VTSRLPVTSKTTQVLEPANVVDPVITTETRGFPDIIPTLIPALQSSSYVLIILIAFVGWSSRKLVTSFLDRHLDLMGTVKDSLEAQTIVNGKHVDIMAQLTKNNEVLAHTLEVSAETRAQSTRKEM
jgi:hypothetical protein